MKLLLYYYYIYIYIWSLERVKLTDRLTDGDRDRQTLKLAFYDVEVQYINNYTQKTPLLCTEPESMNVVFLC